MQKPIALDSTTMKILLIAAVGVLGLSTQLMASVDPVNVPDAGTTMTMLSVAVAGLVLLRRKF